MEVFSGLVVLLLLVADVSEAPPSTVMPDVVVESLLEGTFGFGEVLVIDVFVTAEGVGIRILGVELNGSGEELQRLLMLFLKGEAISNCDPGFRRIDGLLERLMGKEAEIDLLLEMPQTTRVVLDSLNSVGLDLVSLLIVLRCLVVLHDFHVSSSDGGEHPACVEVILW